MLPWRPASHGVQSAACWVAEVNVSSSVIIRWEGNVCLSDSISGKQSAPHPQPTPRIATWWRNTLSASAYYGLCNTQALFSYHYRRPREAFNLLSSNEEWKKWCMYENKRCWAGWVGGRSWCLHLHIWTRCFVSRNQIFFLSAANSRMFSSSGKICFVGLLWVFVVVCFT